MPRTIDPNTGLPIIDDTVNYIEAELDIEGVGTPSANAVPATYVGQRYWNCTGAAGARLYIATAVGTPGTWVAATGV